MSSEIDLAGHTISAGSGALLYGVVDRVFRFFRDRDKEKAERALLDQLAEIKGSLASIRESLKASDRLAQDVADLRVAVAELKGIEAGRKMERRE